jgi:hypothetical protein
MTLKGWCRLKLKPMGLPATVTRRGRRAGLIALPLAIALLTGLGGCGARPAACVPQPAPRTDVVYLIDHGWHTDIAIPSGELRGKMTVFQRIFPGLQVLVVGFGKRTFMMAPVTTSGDLLIGPFPGDGTILAVGLKGAPAVAYDQGIEATIALPPGGAKRLSDFVWNTLKVEDGTPEKLADGFFPGSIFYATRTGYAGTYTCNTWTADALHAAGLPIDADGVVFAGQTMSRAAPLSGGLCAIKDTP